MWLLPLPDVATGLVMLLCRFVPTIAAVSLAHKQTTPATVATLRIDTLTFVKGVGERWIDLATIPLGDAQKK